MKNAWQSDYGADCCLTQAAILATARDAKPLIPKRHRLATVFVARATGLVFVARATALVFVARATALVFVVHATALVFVVHATALVFVVHATALVFVARATGLVFVARATALVFVVHATALVFVARATAQCVDAASTLVTLRFVGAITSYSRSQMRLDSALIPETRPSRQSACVWVAGELRSTRR